MTTFAGACTLSEILDSFDSTSDELQKVEQCKEATEDAPAERTTKIEREALPFS